MKPLAAVALAFALGAPAARAQAPLEILREEAVALRELVTLGKRLAEAEVEVGWAAQEQAALEVEVGRARSLLRERRESLDRSRDLLRRRLRVLARTGRRGTLGLIVSSRDVATYRKRRRVLARALGEDLERLRAFREEVNRVQALAAIVADRESRVRALRAELERRRDALLRLRRERVAVLEGLRRRGVPARLARARRLARMRLARLVRLLAREAHRASSVRRVRGRLPHPVSGTLEVLFGTVRESLFGTVTVHPGWRYRAPAGARVAAVYRGRVVFARTLPGYGRMVIVDHGSKVHSVTARLETIAVREGERVRAGTMLGTVAASGEVYFEIRDRGRPVDPARWVAPARGVPGAAAALSRPRISSR